jgi:hypothetical protein
MLRTSFVVLGQRQQTLEKRIVHKAIHMTCLTLICVHPKRGANVVPATMLAVLDNLIWQGLICFSGASPITIEYARGLRSLEAL